MRLCKQIPWLLCALLLLAVFVACSSDDAAQADGDASDGDMSDGDASDGDTPDGDTLDGDVPGDADLPGDGDLDSSGETDVEAEKEAEEETPACPETCVYGEDLPTCLSETELCWCDEDTNRYIVVDCNQTCLSEYGEAGVCDYDNSVEYERCLCGSNVCDSFCCSNEECEELGSDYCMIDYCVDACDIDTCDPGTDTIACIDYGTPGQPFGVCFDAEGPDCDTPNEFCGGDENHICMAFQSGDRICMEICEPTPNTCGAEALCIPLNESSSGKIFDGGCLEL